MRPIGGGEKRSRIDIQALRGFAVIAVILFHSGLGVAPMGFLGVDVFFVVSGFLIGGIVMRQLGDGSFHFRDFYLRRVRRLVPAAYTVLTATTLASICLLTPSGYARFWPQLIGAIGFAGNVVLWRQINYFNPSAAVAPLLHMWSLAVEEQFYLLLPLALRWIPRRLWLTAVLFGTAASLAAYTALYPRSPGLAFYLLPTRAWEIGLGTVGACLADRDAVRTVGRRLVIPALLVLAEVVVAPPLAPPWWFAAPACVATLAILLADAGGAANDRLLRPLAWFGDRSYALYLVHWPLFAFAHVLYLGDALPPAVSIAVVTATLGIAMLVYRVVEEPVRRSSLRPRTALGLYLGASVALAALGVAGLAVQHSRANLDLRGVTGLDRPGCDGDAVRFDGRCTDSAAPTLLIWGDSFSQHLIPALSASGANAIVQASKGQCAPLLGVAPVDDDAGIAFARGCLAFNRSVVAYLAETPSVRIVVLSGNYARYARRDTLVLGEAAPAPAPIDMAGLVAAQRRTTQDIRALGKRVILISGPPQARFDVGQCWERALAGLPSVTRAPRCAITPANADPRTAWTAALMTGFAASARTPVLRLDRLMCRADTCPTIDEGVPLYRDANHLSSAGSVQVGRRFALAAQVREGAR